MRKLILKMSLSLDGFVAGPNGEIDWLFRTAGGGSTEWVLDTIRQAGAHAMGSRTYYGMAQTWPHSDSPFAGPMNEVPKIVFARQGMTDGTAVTPKKDGAAPSAAVLKSWAEPVVVRGELAEEVGRLKGQPGNYILAHGGARFAQSLAEAGLIDEYRLAIHPVVLGRGLPLFSAVNKPVDLKLISATTFGSGVVGIVYQPK